MIVSESHRYVFLQFPQAASTAVGDELIAHYEGRRILRKHSMLHHFRDWAGESFPDYFTFSSIRNPLSKVVSLYYKLKTDHKGQFSDPANWSRNGGWVTPWQLRRFRYAQKAEVRFSDFFRRFYWLPHVDWSTLDHQGLDFVIRVEYIHDDFSRALDLIGLEQVRPLPVVNRTKNKSRDLESEYPPGLRPHAGWVMGPIMEHLGYAVPAGWPQNLTSFPNRALFNAIRSLKGIYYRRIW